ncbi:FixH family protein [Bacteroidetes bacterium endosymbiont of Geopemphigus sp.]|uniref:FixH family protein n=1 Tax=Bacteroidetes bacterium endosymbiont of Geopemphigus sp. TaxID=2047937 RepID=UPI000CD16D0C|nr:FixH family protein [Bacteroidetes bacterium endosymbiont of Geopemphigus sp.]
MKIRFHWGTGLAIALITFMVFIVYIAFIRPNVASQLVSDRYYEEEMKYQDIIDERNNANVLPEKLFVEVLLAGIKIHFPKAFRTGNTTGKFHLLCPSDKLWDVNKSLNLDARSEELIPARVLREGAYVLIIRWSSDNKKYFMKQPLVWKQ